MAVLCVASSPTVASVIPAKTITRLDQLLEHLLLLPAHLRVEEIDDRKSCVDLVPPVTRPTARSPTTPTLARLLLPRLLPLEAVNTNHSNNNNNNNTSNNNSRMLLVVAAVGVVAVVVGEYNVDAYVAAASSATSSHGWRVLQTLC